MPYAQRNYNELQGIPPQKYRINQIGCFLTSFCNLLERFGRGVDPITLNRIFRDRGIFIDVDDGVRDDLGYQSVTAYDGQIAVARIFGVTNTNKLADNRISSGNSIVRIAAGNRFGTHFCLVHDIRDGIDPLVIDSFDGAIKLASVYGPVTGWAAYEDLRPQPVKPIVNAPTGPNYDGDMVTIQTGWGLSHAAQAAGWPDADKDTRWAYIAQLNGSADWKGFNARLNAGNRIHVGKYVAPTPEPVPPAEVPTPEATATEPTPTDTVPVKVVSFKDSLEQKVQKYIAVEDVVVKDLDGLQADTKLPRGYTVLGVSTFTKDDIQYVRTKKSTDNNWWYGIPYSALKPKGTIDDVDDDDLYNLNMADEAKELFNTLTTRERFVAFIAKVQGTTIRLFTFWKRKNKKGAK